MLGQKNGQSGVDGGSLREWLDAHEIFFAILNADISGDISGLNKAMYSSFTPCEPLG